MRYILDVDHTLLDTERFVADVARDGRSEILVTPSIWEYYEPRDYLFPDVFDWLRAREREQVAILTACTPALGPLAREFQREKIRCACLDEFAAAVVVMEGEKGPYVHELAGGEAAVFLDDSLVHLRSARREAPQVRCVQMHRPEYDWVERSADPEIPVVGALAELDAMMNSS